MTVSQLFNKDPKKWTPEEKSEVLDLYKFYVEMADRISARRHSANSFFLTINTALVALSGYMNLHWFIAAAGILLAYVWYRGIASYKGLNSGKFKVVHKLEKQLCIALYTSEWLAVGEGKNPKLYKPFSKVEMIVPFIFMGVHGMVLLTLIWPSIQAKFSLLF